MQVIRTIFSGLVTLAAVSASAQSQPVVFQSAAIQTALLELFTSEGCSSCPPAETWLSSLKDSPGLWKEFMPVAFHVDYWDRLGWRDPWASRIFSDRQRTYAASWHSGSIYTPGFVLDGKEWREWPRPKDGPRSSGAKVGVLKVTSADRTNWQVRFTPAGRAGGWYVAHAVLLASGLTSDVKAGENRGRRLNHDFVVTTLKEGPLRIDRDLRWGQLVLNGTPKGQPGHLALAVWVTRSGSPEPVQAVGGWLR